MLLLPDPLDNANGTTVAEEPFDKSIVAGCGVKFTAGCDMTTSDGDGADVSVVGLISSAKSKKKM